MIRFFRCKNCGNVVVKVVDSGMPLSCCGMVMEELTPASTDGVLEKHVPVFEVKENEICVNVGEIDHPMTEDHAICFVVVETDKNVYYHSLCPGDAPKVCFKLQKCEKVMNVYEYCNLHGLYRG